MHKYCTILNRHFRVVFDLAWLSSIIHSAILPTFRKYLATCPRFRDLRIGLMLASYILLVAVAVLTFQSYDPRSHDCPTQYAFDHIIKSTDFPISGTHVAQMVLLILAFVWQIIALYMKTETCNAGHSMITEGNWMMIWSSGND